MFQIETHIRHYFESKVELKPNTIPDDYEKVKIVYVERIENQKRKRKSSP